MISKHHNALYNGLSPNLPLATKDRYYGQDLFRDWYYMLDRIGIAAYDHFISPPYIISGGIVSQGTGDTLNITACIGYVNYSVTVPGAFGATPPPPTTSETATVRVVSTAQTNMAIASATLDGVTPNYVKLKYAEVDGNTRNRARGSGSYAYDQSPGFTFVVDSSAPAGDGSELLLDTFTGTGGGSFTFTKNRDNIINQIPYKPASKTTLASGTANFPSVAHIQNLHITGNVTIRARVIVVEDEFRIESGATVTFENYTNLLAQAGGALGSNYPEILIAGQGGLFSGNNPAAGGFGGYIGTVSYVAGGGGYTASGGDGQPTGLGAIGGLPYITISEFGLSSGIGGNGGNAASLAVGGGAGVGGGGATSTTSDGGDGGPAVLIIVKGNFVNNGTITANGKVGSSAGASGGGGGGGGFLAVCAYGTSSVMGNLNADGGNGGTSGNGGSGGGGGHVACIRNGVSAPTISVAGGTGGGISGANGSVGTSLNVDLSANPERGLLSWGQGDTSHLTAKFIQDIFGYGWGIFL